MKVLFQSFLYQYRWLITILGVALYAYNTIQGFLQPYKPSDYGPWVSRLFQGSIVFVIVLLFVLIISEFRNPAPIDKVLYFIPVGVIAFISVFATQYEDLGLFSTHCLSSGCQATPVHDGTVSLYFSIITLTTVGYGDYIPDSNQCRWFAAAEAFSGYFLLALLIALIINWLQSRKSEPKDDWS